ncbi:3-dehydroquinate synthase II [Dactylosporangium salmoneum]|uniref:3-dehydroquinate synthase II n=1 Tax=Dactylosporangium salmoneum TaxID=53361 RepID=A0ABN3FTM5_9ACTN
MKQCWLDIRSADDALKSALCQEAIHRGFDAIVAADPADLDGLPPTVTRVLLPGPGGAPSDIPEYIDLVLGSKQGAYVEVVDAETLAEACESVVRDPVTVVRFADPTNIPLEIVLAAAADAGGVCITVLDRPEEAAVFLGVLEHGPDGVMIAPTAPGEAGRLKDAVERRSPDLALTELTVTGITHAGMGERACVDTCTYLAQDEGILVGSRAKGMVLCVSETHPLPYMPTRPFRVNAGAIMSYTLTEDGHTRYLSELRAGGVVLAVGADGRTRPVVVGRVKIETRPLLSVDAVSDSGEPVNLILQDDWHVRVLGPGGKVLNSTALRPGDRLLGYLPQRERHVGYPIDELCYEQ